MKRKLRVGGVLAAFVMLIAVLVAGIGGLANAASRQVSPNGSYFEQGTVVNICYNTLNESQSYIELHSDTLGNCAAGWVQLSVWADPDGVVPDPVKDNN